MAYYMSNVGDNSYLAHVTRRSEMLGDAADAELRRSKRMTLGYQQQSALLGQQGAQQQTLQGQKIAGGMANDAMNNAFQGQRDVFHAGQQERMAGIDLAGQRQMAYDKAGYEQQHADLIAHHQEQRDYRLAGFENERDYNKAVVDAYAREHAAGLQAQRDYSQNMWERQHQADRFEGQNALNSWQADYNRNLQQQHGDIQARLFETQLTATERQRMNQMREAIAGAQDDPSLSPAHRQALITRLRTGLNPYMAREAESNLMTQELQQDHLNIANQAALAHALTQRNLMNGGAWDPQRGTLRIQDPDDPNHAQHFVPNGSGGWVPVDFDSHRAVEESRLQREMDQEGTVHQHYSNRVMQELHQHETAIAQDEAHNAAHPDQKRPPRQAPSWMQRMHSQRERAGLVGGVGPVEPRDMTPEDRQDYARQQIENLVNEHYRTRNMTRPSRRALDAPVGGAAPTRRPTNPGGAVHTFTPGRGWSTSGGGTPAVAPASARPGRITS